MKLIIFLTVLFGSVFASAAQTRCGWIQNPTPANNWITDKNATWYIGIQGGHQAEGDLAYPPHDQYVYTNGNYGYWCGCITADFNKSNNYVTKIYSSLTKPLDACRLDPSLDEPFAN
ncbi:MAG: DUF4087 domain-containing protein [Bdellovibrionales bacterium]|nr:DUF4087 domain-containing protein [Bdellovibrionales bacterium]